MDFTSGISAHDQHYNDFIVPIEKDSKQIVYGGHSSHCFFTHE